MLLIIFLAWCLILIFLKLYTSGWASGSLESPVEPPRKFTRSKRDRYHGDDHDNYDSEDEETSSTSHSSGERTYGSALSIGSHIFYTNQEEDEEMTMAVIAREQRRDRTLQRQKQKAPKDFSTTTNGDITLVTTRDRYNSEDDHFCVYIPHSLRTTLLRTYHDCLIHPNDENNPETMIYEYFTWPKIRRDADHYIQRYRETLDRGDNAAIVVHDDQSDEDSLDDGAPITLDVIAGEQAEDSDLKKMMERVPNVFSTATNGSIQLVTARGKDKKYRIVIPKSLQAKVMRTYHDCLVNPTEENNFDTVLYSHFTWNGIHRDVADYARNEGLTDEMRERGMKRKKSKKDARKQIEDGGSKRRRRSSHDSEYSIEDMEETQLALRRGDSRESSMETHSDSTAQPIGLDEIAREQKKDRQLRQLKKEEPFVFSTVRYGNTLLTTAQNFRDNKYRIVIPTSLQGRMLLTYRECLLNPTPDRNFDTLLYNHFTVSDDITFLCL